MITNRIILASSSPRRIAMMKSKGFDPVIIPPLVDETLPPEIKPHIAVMFLALKKALYSESLAIKSGYTNGEILIAADTVVVYEGRVIGKPGDRDEAYEILKKLCGQKHTVITGVAVIIPGTVSRRVFCEKTDVYFKSYTDDDINRYIATPEPYDKAGAYAIQGEWGQYVDHINGEAANVMGFPWNRIESCLQNYFIS